MTTSSFESALESPPPAWAEEDAAAAELLEEDDEVVFAGVEGCVAAAALALVPTTALATPAPVFAFSSPRLLIATPLGKRSATKQKQKCEGQGLEKGNGGLRERDKVSL